MALSAAILAGGTGCLPISRATSVVEPIAKVEVGAERAEAAGQVTEIGATAVTASAVPPVRFVYFLERGVTYDPSHHDALVAQAVALQAFWYEQFGATFTLGAPIVEVVEGVHDVDWYVTTPNRKVEEPFWRGQNVWDEVRRSLGLVANDKGTRAVVFPHSGPDGQIGVFDHIEGYGAGAAVMDVDDIWCAAGEAPTEPYPGAEANCLALIAHELGHVFGLEHEGPLEGCMQYGFYDRDSMCEFTDADRARVLESPHAAVLGPLPGEHMVAAAS
jgi:hypothetical protein